jgi:hypothetical protein
MRHKGPYQRVCLCVAGGLWAAAFLACGRSAPTIPSPPPVPDAGTIPPVDAGPALLPGLKLTARSDGGTVDLLAPDASVPPGALLVLEAGVALDDFRVRLLDDDDRLIEGQTRLRSGDGLTQVEIQPRSALPATRCCRLVLDGQLEPLPSAAHRFYRPWQASLTIEPSPDALRKRGGAPVRRHKHHVRRRRS